MISRSPLGGLRARLGAELAEKFFGVLMIDLLEHVVGERKAANLEPALTRRSPIIEILVGGFQEAEVISVHLFAHAVVGSKHDSILKFQEQSPSAARLPPEFCLAGS